MRIQVEQALHDLDSAMGAFSDAWLSAALSGAIRRPENPSSARDAAARGPENRNEEYRGATWRPVESIVAKHLPAIDSAADKLLALDDRSVRGVATCVKSAISEVSERLEYIIEQHRETGWPEPNKSGCRQKIEVLSTCRIALQHLLGHDHEPSPEFTGLGMKCLAIVRDRPKLSRVAAAWITNWPAEPDALHDLVFLQLTGAWHGVTNRYVDRRDKPGDPFSDLTIEDAMRIVLIAALAFNREFAGREVGLNLHWEKTDSETVYEGRRGVGLSLANRFPPIDAPWLVEAAMKLADSVQPETLKGEQSLKPPCERRLDLEPRQLDILRLLVTSPVRLKITAIADTASSEQTYSRNTVANDLR